MALAGELRPVRFAALARVGLVERRSDAFLLPSPALLQLAVRLERAGVELDLAAAGARLLRKRMARTAEDLAELFLARPGKRARGGLQSEALRELRPIALDAVRLVFAQEMERVLRGWIDQGRTAKMSRSARDAE